MTATALAPDGTIGRVDFYAGTSLLGSVATVPYQFTWASPGAGAQSLIAKAYDLQGVAAVSAAVPISVTGNRPPTVAIASPPKNAQFAAPANITLSVITSDPDGTVAKVDYFANGLKVASGRTIHWKLANVHEGNYVLTAIATDDMGATATSPAIAISVASLGPTVTLATPENGAKYGLGRRISSSWPMRWRRSGEHQPRRILWRRQIDK